MQRRCDRNRKRSKRREIRCPAHGCHLDSVGLKHRLFAERAGQLQERGIGRKTALLLFATHTTVSLDGEWLEEFWCAHCQATAWYHVRKVGERSYSLSVAPRELWEQATGVIDPAGNTSVSEFTRKQSRMLRFGGVKDFRFVS